MLEIVAWCLCLVAALVGLALKDIRLHGATLAIALVMLVLILTHNVPR
jgi:uncharacterized membrane protein